MRQLSLFEEEQKTEAVQPKPKKKCGGSQNPIVFNNYESFIAKFTENPKTTDECWTPQDVYAAVVDYVGTLTDLSSKTILRPFFPGGDFEHAEYPEDGVVIDNPPFSIATRCVRFFCQNDIPFFLFFNGMTIGMVYPYCTAIIINRSITFSNGAEVRINFATNLCGDLIVKTAPELSSAIGACASQNKKVNLPVYQWPDNLLTVSTLQIIAKSEHFELTRHEAKAVKNLKNSPRGLFGTQLLVSTAAVKAAAAKAAAAKAVIPVELSPIERQMVRELDNYPNTHYYRDGDINFKP